MDPIIISVFNDGVMELAHNHLKSLVNAGVKNYCAYTIGKKSYNFLKDKGFNIELINSDNYRTDAFSFTEEAFSNFSYLRYTIILKLLESHRLVWYLYGLYVFESNKKYNRSRENVN